MRLGASAALLIGTAFGFDVERRGEVGEHVTWDARQPACRTLPLCPPCDPAVALCVFVGFAKSRSSHSF